MTDIPSRLPWPMILQIIGVVAAVGLVVATWEIWLLFFTALILAAAILPAARWGERRRIPRGVVVLAVYVGAVGLLTLMGRLLWPALSEQWSQFTEQLPKLIDNARTWLGRFDYWLAQWGASLPQPKADNVQGLAGSLLGNVLRVTTGAVGVVVEVLAVLVLAAIALAVMIACQSIEGKVLAPYFVGRATGLHALAVLFALLAGFKLHGLLGGLVAVPLLAGAWEIVRTLWVEPRRRD